MQCSNNNVNVVKVRALFLSDSLIYQYINWLIAFFFCYFLQSENKKEILEGFFRLLFLFLFWFFATCTKIAEGHDLRNLVDTEIRNV